MRPYICLVLFMLLATPAWPDDPQVPAIPATIPATIPEPTKAVETGTAPAEKSPEALGIEIKPQEKGKVAKKKRARRERDELVESLQARIRALEARQDREVVSLQIRDAIQRPVNSMSVESKTIFNYIPDAIYLIYGAINHVIDVQLQPGEKPSGAPVAGDTVRWIVGQTVSGTGANAVTHILIKPVHPNIETNFLITTDRHSYRLYARSSEDFFIPTVGWNYPEETMMEFAGIKNEQQRLDAQVAGSSLVAENLNFKYKLKPQGDYPWTPVRVFDDGAKTYIQMSPDMKHSEAPVFFIREEKELNLVNYRLRGDYLVVDRLFEEGELRCGKKDVVGIVREKAGWWRSSSK